MLSILRDFGDINSTYIFSISIQSYILLNKQYVTPNLLALNWLHFGVIWGMLENTDVWVWPQAFWFNWLKCGLSINNVKSSGHSNV